MADLGKLLRLIARLRAEGGCPWDREQTLADVRAYLVEEAHEAAAAIDSVVAATAAGGGDGDPGRAAWSDLAEELGDLLFQAAFVATLAAEAQAFDAEEAIDRVHRKMVERHPHVFGRPSDVAHEELADAAAVSRAWERRKMDAAEAPRSLLAGVPASLPALLAAYRMTQKAAAVGFDWPRAEDVLAKLDEERAELAEALAAAGGGGADGPAGDAVREEVGDLLFTTANLARKLGIDPEAALAAGNAKFRRRFSGVESRLRAAGRRPEDCDLSELDALWEESKREA